MVCPVARSQTLSAAYRTVVESQWFLALPTSVTVCYVWEEFGSGEDSVDAGKK